MQSQAKKFMILENSTGIFPFCPEFNIKLKGQTDEKLKFDGRIYDLRGYLLHL